MLLCSCNQHNATAPAAIVKADSSSAQNQYKPGLGEIMAGIQTHHAKLWFAGINSNWKLSDYEIKEIKERLVQAQDIETNRTEVSNIPMIYSAIDTVANAIKQQNLQLFKTSFQLLTNTCNGCHKAVNFEFNVVTIPTAPPVTNQEFKVK